MSEQVSLARLYVLRAMYLGNLVLLGYGIWPQLLGLHRAWEPVAAVAFCFWAALAAVSGLGLRHPLAMLPVLLLQLLYKLLWIAAVWLPLQLAGTATDMSAGGANLPLLFIGGAVADLVVIPWPYVVARFVRARGDRWSASKGSPERSSPQIPPLSGSSPPKRLAKT